LTVSSPPKTTVPLAAAGRFLVISLVFIFHRPFFSL
jgi:hypothetical protein